MKGWSWWDLEPGGIEQLLAALLIEMHPGAVRVDGRGGDDGIDVEWEGPHGTEIFEIKSFRRRLNSSQKNQIKRSLLKALTHDPHRWHLVLPLDCSPSEKKWLKELRGETEVPLTWFGLTKIEAELAKRYHLVRGNVLSVREEALQAVAEYGREDAILAGGVPDLTKRMQVLQARASEADPDFDLDFSSVGGIQHVRLRPRTPDALIRRPVTGQLNLTVPNDEDGQKFRRQFNRALRWRVPLTIPPVYVNAAALNLPLKMGFVFGDAGDSAEQEVLTTPPTVTLNPAAAEVGRPGRLRIKSTATGKVLHNFPVVWKNPTVLPDEKGASFELVEKGDRFRFWIDVPWPDQIAGPGEHRTLKSGFAFPDGPHRATPSERLDVLRGMAAICPGNTLELEIDGEVVQTLSIDDGNPDGLVPPEDLELFAALAQIEEASVPFEIPTELATEHIGLVFQTSDLIREGHSSVIPPRELSFTVDNDEQFFEVVGDACDVPRWWAINEVLSLDFLDPRIRVFVSTRFAASIGMTLDHLRAAVAADRHVTLPLDLVQPSATQMLIGIHPPDPRPEPGFTDGQPVLQIAQHEPAPD